MIKEFLPAVKWLEQDYDYRSKADGGWRSKPRYGPDGSHLHPELDLNQYRRGFYQLLDAPMCGEHIRDLCEDDTGERCYHSEHDFVNKCWCCMNPGAIQNLPWTEEDEKEWLENGNYTGQHEKFRDYMREAHAYLFDDDEDDQPNDIDWWKEEVSAAA